MSDATPTPEVREALEELQQYLADLLPPLVVADSLRLLLRYPPELIATSIHAWGLGQRSQDVALSDYLYHGAKKIYMMSDFRLLPQEPFENFMTGLKNALLDYCPDADRGILATSLETLSESASVPTTQVDLIFRQSVGVRRPMASTGRESTSAHHIAGTGNYVGPKGEPISEEQFRGLRRISMLLERLEAEAVEGDLSKSSKQGQMLATRALTVTARHSETTEELDHNLDRLRSLGLDVSTQDIFNALGQVTPAWVAPAAAPGAEALPPRPHSALESMRRLVTQTDDPSEIDKRYQELVRAAVERLNEGSLAQGVAMLDLAEQLATEKKVEQSAVESARRKGDQGLDLERLRKFAEIPEQHPLLRRVLNYFLNLNPSALFDALVGEGKRDRRRLLLLMLEVHGDPARVAAIDRLRLPLTPGSGDEEFYFRRNMLYILRRLPRPATGSLDEEIALFVRHADPRYPQHMVKEAVAGLGLIKHEKAEKALIAAMEEIELALNVTQDPPPNSKDMKAALDRIAAALARFGSIGAHKALIDHAFKKKTEYGDTMARLAEFAGQDLSNDEEAVKRLLAALRTAAPFKLFGLTLHQSYEGVLHLVQSLASTPTDDVRKIFEELTKKFSDQEFAKVAGKALQNFQTGKPAAEAEAASSLSGDLSLFGVPALVQSLAEAQVSGTLSLKSPKGETFATVVLRQGKLKTCQTGKIFGDEAFWQLLEKPLPGNFLLVRQAEGARETQVGALKEILPLTLEGLRRYDEFQLACAIVPDDMLLKPTEVKPTAHKDEKDGILVKDLWTAMGPGATPRQCEAAVSADSYRVRRMLVHWVEQGSLVAESS